MKMLTGVILATGLAALVAGLLVADAPAARKDNPAPAGPVLEVEGRTQCVPGRKAVIAPVPLHPVEEVLVRPGDRVKKGQVLIKIDDDEPQADVRAKKATLESARVVLKETKRLFDQAEAAHRDGALPATNFHATRSAFHKAEHEANAAQAALEAAQAELEHYRVDAKIDGVIAWLDVHVGMVSRPGTTTWGEILDLSEIDARCDLTPENADRVAVGQAAEVRARGRKDGLMGRIAFVGIAADEKSGLIPVCVRVSNPKTHFRCGVPVRVRFTEALRPNPVD